MQRRTRVVLAVVILMLALPHLAIAQQIKLKDKGLKGTLLSANCVGPISCVLKNLSVDAPDMFLYVTQVCLMSATFAPVTVTAQGTASGILATARLATDNETRCFTFEPARVVNQNDTLVCTESGNTSAGCMVTGILSNK